MLTPLTLPPQTQLRITLSTPKTLLNSSSSFPRFRAIKCVHESSGQLPAATTPKWETILSTAASLYPVYVTVGGITACLKPSIFSWFVSKGPFSYSLSLGLIMLAMGLTLELKDLIGLLMQRPLSVSFPYYYYFYCFTGPLCVVN